MSRIPLPDGPEEEGARFWSLRPDLGAAVSAFGAALQAGERLPIRVLEAARIRIAHINGCEPCSETRIDGGEAFGLHDDFYANVDDPALRGRYAPEEALAIAFAERFAAGPESFDDVFWTKLNRAFSNHQLVELSTACAKWLGLGRLNAVMELARSCPIRLPAPEATAR